MFRPEVIHGSVTTLLEALEDPRLRQWTPQFIVLAYEGSEPWQRNRLQQIWPNAILNEEYGANDGGASAFTCSAGTLHFWSNRSLPYEESFELRVTDLWNTAEAFVVYECGDQIVFTGKPCTCGCVFPSVALQGRTSGRIVLNNGSVVSALCPFPSEQMKNLRAVRVLVEFENTATVLLVEDESGRSNVASMAETLRALGFERVNFSTRASIAELRNAKGKFQTVIDVRGG